MKNTLYRLISFSKPYRFLIVSIILFSFITTASSLFVPVLLGRAIDLLIGQGMVDLDALLSQVIIVGIVILFVVISQWFLLLQTNKITYLISYDLRSLAYKKIHSLPLNYIDTHKSGEIINHIINDIDLVSAGLLQSFTSLFTGIITIVGTIVILCLIQFEVALIIILLTPVSLFVAMFIARKTHKRFQKQLELRSDLSEYVNEMVSNNSLIQSLSFEKRNELGFDEINSELHSNGIYFQFYGALINPTTRFINSFIYNLIGIVGAFYVLGGGFTVGMLSSFLTYANQYTKPFNEISAVINEMQSAIVASQRVFKFLDEENDIDNTAVCNDLSIRGHVEISNVSFRYVSHKPLLENVSATISSGQKVAIVGKTGSGKTTLINLLMRFYDIQSGDIKIDGVDIYSISKKDLRNLFGMVLQDSWLFNGTVRENISYGSSNISDDAIYSAAKKAMVHDFIMTLPNGYDTVLGESGIDFSKGQKQLLCIARIMLLNPPILLLDEATSSIDTRTESKIQEVFNSVMENKTTFIVAHRLSTIKSADIIMVMDNGTIVEQGSHNDLLKQDGYYKKLYESQYL